MQLNKSLPVYDVIIVGSGPPAVSPLTSWSIAG
jgi:hypothetical protein